MNRWQFHFSTGFPSPTNSEKLYSIQSFPSQDPATHLSRKGKAKWKSPLGNFNWFSCVCHCGEWDARELAAHEGGGRLASGYRELQKGKRKIVGCKAGSEIMKGKSDPWVQPHEEISTGFTRNGFWPAGDTRPPGIYGWEHSPRGRSCHTSRVGVGATYRNPRPWAETERKARDEGVLLLFNLFLSSFINQYISLNWHIVDLQC